MDDLKGRNALLTGGSYGIGPHIGRALVRQGINVALAARSRGMLERAAREMEGPVAKVSIFPTDLCDSIEREALVTQVEAALGPIDILVNNAGIHHAGRLHKRSSEQIEAALQTNLAAPMLLTRRLLPGMLQRGRGHIVHVASFAGKTGLPFSALYGAGKYGLVGFNHSLQAELHGTGVFSSAVCSGYVAEEGWWGRFDRRVHPAFGMSTPERVAAAVIRTIKKKKVEIIVNPNPIRPFFALWTLWPDMARRVFRWLKIDEFMKDAALQQEADDVLRGSTCSFSKQVEPAVFSEK